MPTYEYRCEKCGEQFEVFQSFTARPLRRHVACGGSVEKVFHPRGVVFKGSGWYATDSRAKNGSESASNSESKEPKPAKSESAKSSKSSDSKLEARSS